MSDARKTAIAAVNDERDKQDGEFGRQRHDPAYWLAIIGKQFGQLSQRVIQAKWTKDQTAKAWSKQRMYQEAKQIAACAVALMEAIERDELPEEITTAMPADARQRARALKRDDESIHGLQDVELPGNE